MRVTYMRLTLAFIVALVLVISVAELPSQAPELNWYKGNLHTPPINSAGDSSPDTVARWYKEHRYHFLALTDHNYFTDPQGLNSFFAAQERFLLITGEEVTAKYKDAPVHVNAFRVGSTIQPASGNSVLDTLQKNVDRIRKHGAVPSLDHPYFRWAFDTAIFKQVSQLKLFEIYNGSTRTNNEWGLEQMWDDGLTSGLKIYGIAVDDAHQFKEFGPHVSNPGRGWVEVQAPELSQEAVLDALEKGRFYASSGVKLESLKHGNGMIGISIRQEEDEKFRTRFIGKGGKVLDEVIGLTAEYRLKPGDSYVRATIKNSNGLRAWIQPIFEN